jgi:uncharacterized tellurite resistance protein B-like protein
MLGQLRDFLRRLGSEADAASTFRPSDTRLALAALLVHAVAIDGVASEEERVTLRSLLSRNFDLSQSELDLLVEDAVAAESDAVDLYRFTSILKARMGEDERIRVIENLWEMAYADGRSHEFEENLIWRVAELLGVNRRDRIAMKSRVAESLSLRDVKDD